MTSGKPYGDVPSNVQQQPTPFELCFEEQKVQDLKTLLRLSPVAKETYENLQNAGSHGEYGVSREWIVKTKKYWEEEYDWRKQESHINSFPNFKTTITDDDNTPYSIHFTALFSQNPSAIPIAFFHGWPGSFLEFLPIMALLREKYTPESFPYHIIAPSLPGFGLSADPPLDRDWTGIATARLMHKLMLSLGFGTSGYLAQGGDIGSRISRILASTYPECKGMHINFLFEPYVNLSDPNDDISEQEVCGLKRMQEFMDTGRAYSMMHSTRPSTAGLVMASYPLAQLAWIGEKFLAWSDPKTTPDVDAILADVTLYWLSGCFPTSMYTYREDKKQIPFEEKPAGYSYFPCELAPVPRVWAEKMCTVTFFKAHEEGGHFASLERPEALWADVEEWVKTAWKV